MAEYTFNISERANVFGLAPTNLWNAYAWNAFKWGEGTAALPLGLLLGVSESQASVEAASPFIGWSFSIAEAGAFSGSLIDLQIMDAAGYSYVYPDRTTDYLDADFPTWSAASTTSVTWTSATVTFVTWS